MTSDALTSRLYGSLYRIRRVEEELARVYPTDRIKSPVHLSIGQEAVSVGVCDALAPEDVVFGTYRSHAYYLAKGGDLRTMIAELYGRGKVEALVGRAVAGRRDEIFLVSKVMPSNASRAGTIKACERSLKYLGTDRLDLYLLHWPGSYPLTETFEAFDELQSSGKIRFFGVSNFDVPDLTEALSITGPGRIACNQILYHLAERRMVGEVLQQRGSAQRHAGGDGGEAGAQRVQALATGQGCRIGDDAFLHVVRWRRGQSRNRSSVERRTNSTGELRQIASNP